MASQLVEHRLRNHQLADRPLATEIVEVVRRFGAMQAQDYPMARWAIGVRLPGVTDAAVAAAVDSGQVVRTHVLRPTWHLVAAEDIRWMLALTASRIWATMAASNRALGLDTGTFNRANTLIARALSGGHFQTRAELMAMLATEGIRTNEHRAAHLMFGAELEGLVCNGPMRGKQLTYALLDERIPATQPLSRAEAVAELVQRYFSSHGPATTKDFAWWSGLTLTDAQAGLAAHGDRFQSIVIDGKTYWFEPASSAAPSDQVHLLPAFDEYLVSYTDRRAVLGDEHGRHAITTNGIFRPVIVVNGQVVGIWRRTVAKGAVRVEPVFFGPEALEYRPALEVAAARYGEFLGVRGELV